MDYSFLTRVIRCALQQTHYIPDYLEVEFHSQVLGYPCYSLYSYTPYNQKWNWNLCPMAAFVPGLGR